MVLAWPLKKRRAYLDGVEQARGKDGRDYLETEILNQWRQRKATA